VDELGTCRRQEGLEPLAESLLHLLEGHVMDASTSGRLQLPWSVDGP
jgi:hypothetical protein